ncbi:hypothetical protein D3C85_338560 [compost metagenome]
MRIAQLAKVHGEGDAVDLAVVALAVEQGQAGEESDAVAACGEQLCVGAFVCVGFAENLLAQYGDLVRADDQVLRVLEGECAGFFFCQAAHQ